MTDLICFPFAGGNKFCYRLFESHYPEQFSSFTVEYPGRGRRVSQSPIKNINDLAKDAFYQIVDRTRHPYMLYGHSMGALVAFLVLHILNANHHRLPVHVFFTGTTAPSAPRRKAKIKHRLDRPSFLQEIKNYEGTPASLWEDHDLLDFFEPILRADFEAVETYEYKPLQRLNIPFTVITGTQEDLDEDEIKLWQKETILPVEFIKMSGKHFFIHEHSSEIVKTMISKTITTSKM